MTKRLLGVFAALSLVVGAFGCSSSDSGGGGTPDPADAATKTDTKVSGDATPVDSKGGGTDTADPGDSGGGDAERTPDKTTGKLCTSSDECDVTGDSVNLCTAESTGGSFYPEPVCIGIGCETGADDEILTCDGNTGWCLKNGDSSICLPQCKVPLDGSGPATGCAGTKNICNVMGTVKDMAGKVEGAGFCLGGCVADADCPTGNKCQKEQGVCLKKVDVYTKAVGATCKKSEGLAAMVPACYCDYGGTDADPPGYCTSFCKVGAAAGAGACPSGFTCDAALSAKDPMTMANVFTGVAPGLAGLCHKNCTTDADCAGLNSYCDSNPGTGGTQKVCVPGTKM